MQRQSIGSPSRERLAISTNDAVSTTDELPKHRRESSSSSFSTTDDDEIKPEKPYRSNSNPETFIHFIPILIIFCFLVLYLSSHHPSPQDLSQFHIFHKKRLEQNLGNEIDEIGKVKELKRSNAFLIRSLSNLREEEEEEVIQRDAIPKARYNRKFGNF